MNLFDLIVILFAIAAGVGGYRLGFVTRVISWFGMLLGVLVAIMILPGLMLRLDDASDQARVLMALATLLGCMLVGQGIGLAIGSRLQIALPEGNARQADRVAGATLGVVGVLVALWLLLPILANANPVLADQTRGSTLAQRVHDLFPDVPDRFKDLRAMVTDLAPEVVGPMNQAPSPGPPPANAILDASVRDQVRQSTVKVQGVACNRLQEGSGWVVAPDLVVTNAHVVAGEQDTEIMLFDNSERDAEVVAYDSNRDLAVLRVDGLNLPALDTRASADRDTGEVFGHTGGGDMQFSPFQISTHIDAVGRDVYNRQSTERDVLVLASELAPGDSGGALVDANGDVVGTAFAVAPDKDGVAYALDNAELEEVLDGNNLSTPVSTGDCLV